MPTWLRRTAGILTLVGGAVGVAVVGLTLPTRTPVATALAFSLLFTLLYGLGIVIGVWLLKRDRRGVAWGVPYWCLQIPLLSSSVLSYQFATGAFAYVTVTDGRLLLNAQAGSWFDLRWPGGAPLAIGFNLLAIGMSILLWKYRATLPLAREPT
jgi:hypothetical protein